MANETKTKEVESPEKGKALEKAPAHVVSPFEEMERLMDRMSESFFPRRWLRRMRWEWPDWPQLAELPELRVPRVDVVDRDTDILVRAEVPGVEKKDLDISVTEDTITIKGTTKRESKEQKGEYYRREISEASFARTIALPAEVDGTQAKASCTDGVVELVIPKVAKSKRHSIKVD
ncbi:MAG TPA: Hsp20/alpha crystallin family protein [Burkholderiales bacterium]|nr:Hsp20/alpha crystallin family protein [Burkholderiales bacterium]